MLYIGGEELCLAPASENPKQLAQTVVCANCLGFPLQLFWLIRFTFLTHP